MRRLSVAIAVACGLLAATATSARADSAGAPSKQVQCSQSGAPAAGCAAIRQLVQPQSLVMSGSSAYAGGQSIVVFERGADGKLNQKAAAAGCLIPGTVATSNCTAEKHLGLITNATIGVAASPDGKFVYAAVSGGGTTFVVVRFARLDDGSLAFSSCLSGGSTAVPGCDSARGLTAPTAIQVGSDGTVYVVGTNSLTSYTTSNPALPMSQVSGPLDRSAA